MVCRADPEIKARLYAELAVSVTYQPDDAVVIVEAQPWTSLCVEGGTATVSTWPAMRGELDLSAI